MGVRGRGTRGRPLFGGRLGLARVVEAGGQPQEERDDQRQGPCCCARGHGDSCPWIPAIRDDRGSPPASIVVRPEKGGQGRTACRQEATAAAFVGSSGAVDGKLRDTSDM